MRGGGEEGRGVGVRGREGVLGSPQQRLEVPPMSCVIPPQSTIPDRPAHEDDAR